jgi:hypothetical protein
MERIRCFNRLAKESLKNDLLIEVHTTVNNSAPGYASKLERMYKKNAEFPFFIKDIGKKDYFINLELPAKFQMRDGTVRNDMNGNPIIFEARAFDIYRLMAEIFNEGMDYAEKNNMDFYSIQSGDQLVPEDHAVVLTKFLDEHPSAGLVGGIVFFDFSKKKMIRNGKTVEAYRPMVDMDTPEKTAWLWANLFPNEENGYTGLEYAEVRMVGTGGSMIPRDVFTKLKFHTVFDGTGEDIRYCDEIRSILGKKVFVHTGVSIPNRYPSGEKY